MLRLVFTAMCALLSIISFGQSTVSGVVRDSVTQESLVNATVHLKNSKHYAITDSFGRFSLNNVRDGRYTLAVTYLGYKSHEQSLDVPPNIDMEILMHQTSIMSQAVVVRATRATDNTPTTFTTVRKAEIKEQNFGQDVPFLLNWTPSVVTTSDAGNAIGYSGIRIRGSDPTRINVTINGIPYNDSESAGTFWVNIPDIASSSESIQIQRGVGTSTNGAGAFGGTINIQTSDINEHPFAEVINSFGSFNSRRHTVNVGTGLINKHFSAEARVSKIASDGFIDRASSDLKAYFFSGGYFSDRTILKAIIFGGKERTYQSWYGVPQSRLNNDMEAMLMTATNEGWNEQQTDNLLRSNSRTFNPYLYENQVDNYQQDHYQLHFSHQPDGNFTLATALHFTPGEGYYEEFKYDDDFAAYGLPDMIIDDDGNAADNTIISSTDLIRRRWLNNDFYGITYSVNYDKNNWNMILGGAWNRYDGDHFGEILWTRAGGVPFGHRYYLNHGDKRDFNTYLKINYQFTEKFNAFADLQYRKVTYTASGIENNQNEIDVDAVFDFFNPKAGLTYALTDQSQLYASYAIANREPVRDDFVDFEGNDPQHEILENIEIGYRGSIGEHTFHANYYLMNYTNQLVLTGQLNDVGAYVRTNAGKSHRMGVELEALVKLSKKFFWNANLTLSENKIDEYVQVLEDYGADFDEFNIVERRFNKTAIAFSPAIIAGSSFSIVPLKNTEVSILTKYVGKQYLDNTGNDARSISAYLINDLRISYTWKPAFVKQINFSLLVNNILNERYESNGFTYGYLAGPEEYRENFYFPQAGLNFMGMLSMSF